MWTTSLSGGSGVFVVVVVEASAATAFARLSWEGLESFLDCEEREGLVTLLELGPKARVCWARAVVEEGLRRVGGMFGASLWGFLILLMVFATIIDTLWGYVLVVNSIKWYDVKIAGWRRSSNARERREA